MTAARIIAAVEAHPEAESIIKTLWGRWTNSRIKVHRGGRPEVIRTCDKCGWSGNTRAMQAHKCEQRG